MAGQVVITQKDIKNLTINEILEKFRDGYTEIVVHPDKTDDAIERYNKAMKVIE